MATQHLIAILLSAIAAISAVVIQQVDRWRETRERERLDPLEQEKYRAEMALGRVSALPHHGEIVPTMPTRCDYCGRHWRDGDATCVGCGHAREEGR